MDSKITKEDKCTSLLCSFLDLWDNIVMAIKSNNTTLKVDEMVASLLSKEMRWKNGEVFTHEALIVTSRSVNRRNGKPSNGRSISRGKLKTRSTSPTR